MREAAPDQGSQIRERDTFREKALLPEAEVPAGDTLCSFFINRWILIADTADCGCRLVSNDDRVLVRGADTRVWDDGGKKQRVRMAALGALDPADPEHKDPIGKVDAPLIITMYGQAGLVSARAGQPVELEGVYDGIVIILRNLIVFFDRNGYHSLAGMLHMKYADVRQQAALRGRSLLSLYSSNDYDNTEGTGTVNLSKNASE